MIVTFLGTSSGMPTTRRNVSGLALRFIQSGRWWLFDCGEGTQHQIMHASLRVSQLDKIFITHLHGDHLYGLLGLLASRSLRGGATSSVTLYGPEGLQRYVESIMAVSPVHLQYPLHIKTVSEGVVYQDEEISVEAVPVRHRVPAFAYAVKEPERPGAFQADRAKQLGVPPGPLFGQLKRGETIWLPDGRKIEGKELVGPPVPGRKVVYTGDTEPCDAVIQLARNADLLIHESTYAHAELRLARRSAHSTAREAAEVARAANARALILTHFSPRYENEEGLTLDDLLHEARAIFPETMLAADFLSYQVKRRRENDGDAGSENLL